MKPHRTHPSQRHSPSTTAVTVIAVIALLVVLAIGVCVVVNLNEVVGFSHYLRLIYGGWG
ncbi:MAG: hypothetical protein WBO84_04760 [Acidimicrobiia bacterium]